MKEKMQRSVVKWWNVHYMTPEELEEQQEKEQDASEPAAESKPAKVQPETEAREEPEEESGGAQGIAERMSQAKEAEFQQQIEAMRAESEGKYNASTGSYSGAYGSGGADDLHQDQISAILAEKDDALRSLIEQTEEEE